MTMDVFFCFAAAARCDASPVGRVVVEVLPGGELAPGAQVHPRRLLGRTTQAVFIYAPRRALGETVVIGARAAAGAQQLGYLLLQCYLHQRRYRKQNETHGVTPVGSSTWWHARAPTITGNYTRVSRFFDFFFGSFALMIARQFMRAYKLRMYTVALRGVS